MASSSISPASSFVVDDVQGIDGIDDASNDQRDEVEAWMHGMSKEEYIRNRKRVPVNKEDIKLIAASRHANEEQDALESSEDGDGEETRQAWLQSIKAEEAFFKRKYGEKFHDETEQDTRKRKNKGKNKGTD